MYSIETDSNIEHAWKRVSVVQDIDEAFNVAVKVVRSTGIARIVCLATRQVLHEYNSVTNDNVLHMMPIAKEV